MTEEKTQILYPRVPWFGRVRAWPHPNNPNLESRFA
jgi:hypothetical protein